MINDKINDKIPVIHLYWSILLTPAVAALLDVYSITVVKLYILHGY
jgi:hypothetical protein